MSLPCLCTVKDPRPCIYCEAAISAREDGPVNDYAPDFVDNYFESREHPNLWI